MKHRLLSLLTLSCLAISLTLSAGAVEYTGFSDVDDSSDYVEAIQWAAEQGYINGYPDGRFGVNDSVTRAQTAAIFYRAAGSPDVSGITSFSDVQATAYYRNAASWAEGSNLISGYPNGQFGVNDPVTRQQLVTILWRWAGSPNASAEDYADEDVVASYARTAVNWSRSNHILDGREDGRFAPNDSATRAEVVSALYQYRNPTSSGGTSHGQEGQESIAGNMRNRLTEAFEVNFGWAAGWIILIYNRTAVVSGGGAIQNQADDLLWPVRVFQAAVDSVGQTDNLLRRAVRLL